MIRVGPSSVAMLTGERFIRALAMRVELMVQPTTWFNETDSVVYLVSESCSWAHITVFTPDITVRQTVCTSNTNLFHFFNQQGKVASATKKLLA